MAVTQNSYTGNGSTTNYSFTFPYLETTDVKVKLDGVDTTAYSFANATTVQMNSAPANGAKIIIYRNTNNDTKPATFYAGSAIKSEDLNNNYDQILYSVQEIDNNSMSTLGDTAMQGDMLIGQGFGLQFEGATDDDNETRLVAADPTADRVITLPNVTGNVVTTGDTGTVTDTMLSGGTALTSAEKTKLSGIATGAEVNVQSDWNASSGDAQILNKPTIPTDTNTTYSISCVDGDNTDEEKIRLTAGGDGSGTDDIVLETGTGLSIARSGDKITFSNSITNTNQLTNGAGFITNDLNDNVKILLGTGDDLEIYHNGTDSIIKNSTGWLVYAGDSLAWKNAAESEWYIAASNNGAVELYYNNVKKFETKDYGVKVEGDLWLDDDKIIKVGSGGDLQISHDASNSYIKDTGTGNLNITASTVNINNADNSENIARFIQNSHTQLYFDNSKKLETSSTGITVTGTAVATAFSGDGSALTSVTSTPSSSTDIQLNDNVDIYLGSGDDLKLFHNGTNSFIQNQTGNLVIAANRDSDVGGDIWIDALNGERSIKCVHDGQVELYHDGNKKFETNAGGVDVTGVMQCDGITLLDNEQFQCGTNVDLKIYHDGTDTIIDNDTGVLYIKSNTQTVLHVNNTENSITAAANGAVNLYYDNVKKFETTSAGVKVTGDIQINEDEGLFFDGTTTTKDTIWRNSSENSLNIAGRAQVNVFIDSNNDDTNSYFAVNKDHTAKASATELFKVDNDGNIDVTGNITTDDDKNIELGNSSDLKIYHNGTNNNSYIDNNTGSLIIRTNVNADVGGDIFIKPHDNEDGIAVLHDGSVRLHYDGSADPKMATVSDGIELFGDIHLPDSTGAAGVGELTCGAGQDLRIYHDGTHSYIYNITGDLRLYNSNETEAINCKSTGHTSLYYDGTEMAFTHASGFKLNDNKILLIGTGNDLQISHNGTGTLIKNNTGWFVQAADSYAFKNNAESKWYMSLSSDAVELYYDNSKKLETTDTGVAVTGGITVTDKVTQTSTAVSALDIDCSTSNFFTKAISADSTFTFSNVPATGNAYGFVLELDVNGDRTLTWPTAVKWAGGSAPTLTAGKTHLFSLVTVDGGTTWRGSAAVDFTT